jgi:Na+-transporting NADH:ubiquinone oxidoreductase subunit A
MEVRVEADNQEGYEEFKKGDPLAMKREEVIENLLKSGLWPMIRQRPYSVIANPSDNPKAIFVSAFDTAPLAPDYDFVVHGHGEDFQVGLNALTMLTSGKVHLNLQAEAGHSKVFTNSKGVQINEFSGPHPSGNVGTQIAYLDPINKGDIVWYLRPQEVVSIGRLFMQGRLDSFRLIALTGSEVKTPKYYKTKIGTCIEGMVRDNVKSQNVRYISGNPLTGKKIEGDCHVGYYDSQVTVLPEGDYHEFLGWALPRVHKFSFSKSYLSWIMPGRKYKLDTNINGGERALVMTGEFEKVFGWNIYPMQLIKASLIEDIELMEKLGIYEVDEEDFALCEFIDTSKTEIQQIIRNGLDLMRREMS